MSTATLPNPGSGMSHLLDQFLHELGDQSSGLDERRAGVRHQFQAPLTLGINLGSDDTYRPLYRGWGTELSRSGLGFLLEHQLDPGLQMWVNLESALRCRCLLPIRVVYCKQLLPHTFRLGATFTFAVS